VERNEVIDLLALAAAFDRRTVGEADVSAWMSVLGDLNYADARQALTEHYAEHREFAMPADIRGRVKIIRRDRLSAAHGDAAVPDADPDDIPAWLTALREGRMRSASPVAQVASERLDVAAITADAFRGVPDDK
jgi:hypothetical protein